MNSYNDHNKLQLLLFSIFAGSLLLLFIYAGSTGWQFIGGGGNRHSWNSSGPGYHK